MTSPADPDLADRSDDSLFAAVPSFGRRSFITSLVGAAAFVGCSRTERTDDTGSGPATDVVSSDPSDASADGDGELFDPTVIHQVEISFDQEDYDTMIATLADTGDKEWIEVTAVIDGVTYERAGARLKGNSSLMGLFGGRPGGEPGRPPGDAREAPSAAAVPDEPGGTGAPDASGPPAGGGPAGRGRLDGVSADEPEGLPWLIRLDEFVEDQEHLGYDDVVIRSNDSETSLDEAVALDLLEAAGLASQAAASTRFSVNGGPPTLRLMIEHPDDGEWQRRNFDGEGALYKAESTGDWSYRGDDPGAYDEVFDQEGGKDVADLTPLIEFLAFVDEADDATFAAELPDRLDVEAFATYLAMMDLLDNFDDIDGPGNNAYSWWDAATGRCSIVPWDLNRAFGGVGGGGNPPGGRFEPGADVELSDDVEFPDGFQPFDGFEPGADLEPPDGFQPDAGTGPGGGGGRGAFGGSNPLVERFRAVEEFEEMYQQRLSSLDEEFFAGDLAENLLAARVEVRVEQASDLVDPTVVTEEADALTASITRS